MGKPGREFERAVYEFVRTIGPNATVYFDHKVPDCNTGTPRQVDVWVEAKVMNHFPQTFAISCKDHKRPLNISHIGTFLEEVRSTGASSGIIYSRSGFSKNALKKARANGVSCCLLLQNDSPPIPECLFVRSFLAQPQAGIDVRQRTGVFESIATWGDLFALRVDTKGKTTTALELIEEGYASLETELLDGARGGDLNPPSGSSECTICQDGDSESRLTVRLQIFWRYYSGRLEAQFMNGSYCFDNKHFAGTQFGPTIVLKGDSPGPGWEPVNNIDLKNVKRGMLAILYSPDIAAGLLAMSEQDLQKS